MIEIQNRRPWAVNEDQRIQSRQATKEHLAKLELARQRIAEIDLIAREIDARCDRLASEHAETMSAIQAELEEIEGRLIACLSQRQPTSPQDEKKRKELLDAIAGANAKLERDLSDERGLKKPLEAERDRLAKDAAKYDSVKMELASERLGQPDLLDRLHAAKCKTSALIQWRNAAAKKLADAESTLASIQRKNARHSSSPWHKEGEHSSGRQDTSEVQKRIQRHRLELEAADDAVGQARAENDLAYSAVLDE